MNIKRTGLLILACAFTFLSLTLATRAYAADLSSVDLSGKKEELYKAPSWSPNNSYYNIYGQDKDTVYVVQNDPRIGAASIFNNSLNQRDNLYSTAEFIVRTGAGGPEAENIDEFVGNSFAFTREGDWSSNNLLEVNFKNNQVINRSEEYKLFQKKLADYYKVSPADIGTIYLSKTNKGQYWMNYHTPNSQSGSGWGVANEDLSVILENCRITGIDTTTDTLYGVRYDDNYKVTYVITIKNNVVTDISLENVPNFNDSFSDFYMSGDTVALRIGKWPGTIALGTIVGNKIVINKTISDLLDGTQYVKQDVNGLLWAVGGGKLYQLTKDDAIETYKLFDSQEGSILTRDFVIYDENNFTIQSIDMRGENDAVISTYRKQLVPNDMNNDGVVNIFDLAEVGKNYNSKVGRTYWNVKYDLNNDGIIDIFDLARVSKSMNDIQSISLNKIVDVLKVGDTESLTAETIPDSIVNNNVKWSSSDSNIASVDNTGKVTASGEGTAKITATTVDGSKSASCNIIVRNTITVQSITLNKHSDTLIVGGTDTLITTVMPEIATNKDVEWTSSDSNVATVDSKGKITATGAGDAYITATTVDGSKVDSCFVTVNRPIITFKDSNLEKLIRNAINKPTGDLLPEDVEGITTLFAESKSIYSLDGIEYLKSLQSLYIRGNKISDLTPLKGLINMVNLNLSDNLISNLSPLSGLTNLTSLTISANRISDISALSGLINLTTLFMSENQISDLNPISELNNLSRLYMDMCQISDLSPLMNLTNLTSVSVKYNQIINIKSLSSLVNLTEVWLAANQINDVSPLMCLNNMVSLDLGQNQISDINPLGSIASLQSLNLFHNNISYIDPLMVLTNLQMLSLNTNPVNQSNISRLKVALPKCNIIF